jgi:hypothetical protein
VRLQQEEPYLDTWAEAMRIGAEPENISTTSMTVFIQRICFGAIATKFGEDAETNLPITITTQNAFFSTQHMQQLNYIF